MTPETEGSESLQTSGLLVLTACTCHESWVAEVDPRSGSADNAIGVVLHERYLHLRKTRHPKPATPHGTAVYRCS